MNKFIMFIMMLVINVFYVFYNVDIVKSETGHACKGKHEHENQKQNQSKKKHDHKNHNDKHEQHKKDNDPKEHEEHQKDEGHEGHEKHEDVVILSQKDIKDFEIEILEAKSAIISNTITLLGEVVVNANKQAHITPRFAGLVLEVKKEEGDYVKKGDVLALIEANDSLNRYELKSLINGVILKRHITVGEVHGNGTIAFVIADLNNIWVHLNIYQKDLSLIKEGQTVIISLSNSMKEIKGIISYISPIIDEKTRTSIARVELKNINNMFKPGMFVKSKVLLKGETVKIAVKKEALQLVEGRKCIFIKKNKNKFEAVHVKIGHENEKYIEIISGLNKGDKYAAKGSFVLKSEVEKGAFGDGHNH